jgi:uncharacterized protein
LIGCAAKHRTDLGNRESLAMVIRVRFAHPSDSLSVFQRDTRCVLRSRDGVATLVSERGTVVCERCCIASHPFARMRGLLGRRNLPQEEGILIRPASSVHTWFMQFPIDVVFLDRDLSVVRIVPRLQPWRTAGRWRAAAVLELAAGESARRGIAVGDRLHVDATAAARR